MAKTTNWKQSRRRTKQYKTSIKEGDMTESTLTLNLKRKDTDDMCEIYMNKKGAKKLLKTLEKFIAFEEEEE